MAKLQDLPKLLATANWDAAERLLKREAGRPQADPGILYNLGKVLEANGKWHQSGPWFERAIAANPQHQNAWFELGRWSLEHGKLSDAFEQFSRSLELSPDDDDARRNVARIALRLGNWQIARQHWETFDDPEARIALFRISAELGEDTSEELAHLLATRSDRPTVLKAMTRTAKGKIPLTIAAD